MVTRGKTPDNILEQCYQICVHYLSGKWLSISKDEIIMKRLTGGFTNQSYYCALPEDITCLECEPREVVIKLYGKKHFKSYDKEIDDDLRLTDGLISYIVANNNLCPQLYGVYTDGQIMQYIEVLLKINKLF
jgi:hypothetical protein